MKSTYEKQDENTVDRRKDYRMKPSQATKPLHAAPVAPATTTVVGDRAVYWRTHGSSIDRIKELARGELTVGEMRAAWDYRAEGLSAEAARKIIRAWADHRPWVIEKRGKNKARGLWTATDNGSCRFVLLAARRREDQRIARDNLARLLVDASPAKWMAGKLDWQNNLLVLPLPDGGCVATERCEDVEWDDRRHWPTSREVTYSSTCYSPSGATVGKVDHDRRGAWQARVLVALGLVTPEHTADRRDMPRRLHPACAITGEHVVDCMSVARRTVAGATVDYVAFGDGVAYHAYTVRDSIVGLRRKLALRAAKADGKALSADIAARTWGFCRPGLAEFASASGLSLDGEYLVDEVKARINDSIRERFGDELRVAGLIP